MGSKHNALKNLTASEIVLPKLNGNTRVILCYPNNYSVGMSNLGFQSMYGLFNSIDDVRCERAFLDTDGKSLESGIRLRDADIIAFSVSFELDYPNIVKMLLAGGIDPYAKDRDEKTPVIIIGGAVCYYNPLPVAPFFDLIFEGDGEEDFEGFASALLKGKDDGFNELKGKDGMFIPEHGDEITRADFLKTKRKIVKNLDDTPIMTQIYTDNTEFGSMGLVEISRGCKNGCKFCIASHGYSPCRYRSLSALKTQFDEVLQYRDKIGLVGAAVTDHPEIIGICEYILSKNGKLSPASMSAKKLTPELLSLLYQGGVRSITLAPECGSEVLRKTIGKGATTDELLFNAIRNAVNEKIKQLKLYFMIGLPEETDDDVLAIADLALKIRQDFKINLTIGVSSLVPKPLTPFAGVDFTPVKELDRKLALIRKSLKGQVNMTAESTKWSYYQSLFASGGSNLAEGIYHIGKENITSFSDWNKVFLGLDIV